MTSNGIANTPSRFHSSENMGLGGCLGILWKSLLGESFHASRSSPGAVLGDLVDAAAWGSKIYVGRGVEVGVSCGDVDSFQDDPQYKLLKYLVFETILSSLLSELQIIIPVNPML